MKKLNVFMVAAALVMTVGCAHESAIEKEEKEASRFNRKLVKEAVVFEPGTESNAVVPDVSAPRLRAIWVPEKIDNGKLIEAHREWLLEGDVSILGIPKQEGAKK